MLKCTNYKFEMYIWIIVLTSSTIYIANILINSIKLDMFNDGNTMNLYINY
jgi:hypothetical protein